MLSFLDVFSNYHQIPMCNISEVDDENLQTIYGTDSGGVVITTQKAKIEGEFGAHEESELWSTSKPLGKLGKGLPKLSVAKWTKTKHFARQKHQFHKAKIEGEFGAHEESELWSTSKPLGKLGKGLSKLLVAKWRKTKHFARQKHQFCKINDIRVCLGTINRRWKTSQKDDVIQTPSEDDFSEDEWLSFTFLGVMEAK
ncbi:hypothetical protein CK203_060572 [Vitis vinifera]|uniref:Uncharacterized protein n=1 Tax=Vitis vinifera TaxID=29760 RepID=A0A438FTT7_VITVI|nr:hypothetical protein CK203_060572 [Vitis vinifera]